MCGRSTCVDLTWQIIEGRVYYLQEHMCGRSTYVNEPGRVMEGRIYNCQEHMCGRSTFVDLTWQDNGREGV